MGRNDEEQAFAWSVRPAAGERGKGIAAAALVLLAVYGALRWGGAILGIAAGLLLAGGIGPFFVSTTYRLTPEGVSVRSPFLRVDRPWTSFRRTYIGARGVSLSPFAGHHLLEPYRSVMLRYGPHRETVLAWVSRYGPPPPTPPGPPPPTGEA